MIAERPAGDDARIARAAPDPEALASGALFCEDAVIRRISRENAVLMGGGCALLLEVAHPLVAAGVARHSAFRTDPFGRLHRTLTAVSAIVFGTTEQALKAANQVERAHRPVHGVLGAAAGRFAADARYAGASPELICWVWATLAWTTVRVHERLLDPIERTELDTFHREQACVARLLGVPTERAPANRGDFVAYFDRVRRDTLCVTEEGRTVASALFDSALQGPMAGVPGAGLARALATSLLPEELRDPFGLEWSPASEERLDQFADRLRAARRR